VVPKVLLEAFDGIFNKRFLKKYKKKLRKILKTLKNVKKRFYIYGS